LIQQSIAEEKHLSKTFEKSSQHACRQTGGQFEKQ
jgi:uncharacterized protein YktA (UPF0223 family)